MRLRPRRGGASGRGSGRRLSAGLALLVALGAVACTIQERTDRQTAAAAAAPSDSATSEFIFPWGESQAPRGVRSGSLIWIWAMPGLVPGAAPPRLVEGGAAAETRQALANVSDVLTEAGGELRDVAQCSAFVADAADFAAVAEAYGESFPAPPARMAVVPAGLAMGARVELECTAVVSGGP